MYVRSAVLLLTAGISSCQSHCFRSFLIFLDKASSATLRDSACPVILAQVFGCNRENLFSGNLGRTFIGTNKGKRHAVIFIFCVEISIRVSESIT